MALAFAGPEATEEVMLMRSVRFLAVTACAIGLVGVSAVAASASQQSLGGRAAVEALAQRGVPYVWGGASPDPGFDSSGLVMWVYAKVGHLQLPHSAPWLKPLGQPVSRTNLRPGDLVFFEHNLDVGIYVGSGRFVHAPGGARTKVRLDSLFAHKFAVSYSGAVRLRPR